MKTKIITICLFTFLLTGIKYSYTQKHDNYWLGENISGGSRKGAVLMQFGEEKITYHVTSQAFSIHPGILAMSNAEGELQFYTNGNVVASWDNRIMQGGKGFNQGATNDDFLNNPPWFPEPDTTYNTSYNPYTYQVIPDTDDPHIYYMIHAFIIQNGACTLAYSPKMQISKIDMSANSGLGRVVYKNHYFDQEPMGGGCLVRHGNGRDWWVVLRKQDGLAYRSILLHRDSVVQVVQSSIPGLSTDWFSSWEDCYYTSDCLLTPSLDGSRLVDKYGANWTKLLAFDRCSGEVSLLDTFKTGITPLVVVGGNVVNCPIIAFEFSPSGRYLYGAGCAEFAQWDLESTDISASKVRLGGVPWSMDDNQEVMVGFRSGYKVFAYGPEGKIYNMMRTSHNVIHYPDEQGEASGTCIAADLGSGSCLGPDVPYYLFSNRHPNFRLGALEHSPCDTLLSSLSPPLHPVSGYAVKVSPSPATGPVHVEVTVPSYASPGELRFFDTTGRLVHRHQLPPYAYLHTLDVSAWPAGVYNIVLLQEGKVRAVQRLVRGGS